MFNIIVATYRNGRAANNEYVILLCCVVTTFVVHALSSTQSYFVLIGHNVGDDDLGTGRYDANRSFEQLSLDVYGIETDYWSFFFLVFLGGGGSSASS